MSDVNPTIAHDTRPGAPPRRNGELVFEAPWESRAFGVAVALSDAGVLDYEAFRATLIAEIGAWEEMHGAEQHDYYARWVTALEGVLRTRGIVERDALDECATRIRHARAHEHDHDHNHGGDHPHDHHRHEGSHA